MYEESLFTLNLKIEKLDTPIEQSYTFEEEPFKILYNARTSKNSNSRKGSISRISDVPKKEKKPRKMTLPI